MPIVFSAITPHSPVILPEIGKDNIKSVNKTDTALHKLEKTILEKEIDTIIIISPHSIFEDNIFRINLADKYQADFKEFGNFSLENSWQNNLQLTYYIRSAFQTQNILQLTSSETINYSFSVPLLFLTKKIPNVKIIPLYVSNESLENHFKFGEALHEELQKYKKNIAIIASGELSHVKKNQKKEILKKAKKFDQNIIEFLQKNNYRKIIEQKEETLDIIAPCGVRPITLLTGIISKIKHKPKLLSYESPFGVGYLVMNFEIKN